jgi:hypothetical protein
MKAFKAFFLSRLMREKALLLAFVGIGAVIWLSSFVGRARTFARGFRQTTQEFECQNQGDRGYRLLEVYDRALSGRTHAPVCDA